MSLSTTVDILSKIRLGVTAVGLVGNSISFLVFSRRVFRNNSINIYCRSLIIFDSIVILLQFANLSYLIFFNSKPFVVSNALCKFNYYVYIGIAPISGWILTAYSIDKAMCVVCPNRYEFIRKTKFQLAVIFTIALFNCLIYLEIPVSLNNVEIVERINGTNETRHVDWSCSTKQISYYRIINLFYFIESSILPFFIMFITTIVIVRALYMSRMRVETKSEKNRDISMRFRRAKDMKFAANSIVLNLLFVLLQSPISLSSMINFSDQNTYVIFYYIASILYYMNYSISFFAHFASNSMFKREFLRIMRFSFKSQVITTTTKAS